MRTSAWLVAAYSALGFLVGNLAGLSAAKVTTSLLGLLFAFGGGTAIALLKNLNDEQRRMAGQAILALSVSCLLGTYTGIGVAEYQLMTPEAAKGERKSVVDRKLMREHLIETAHSIDQRLANRDITVETAYRELLKEATRQH
jgi:hypothetical protein